MLLWVLQLGDQAWLRRHLPGVPCTCAGVLTRGGVAVVATVRQALSYS